MYRFLKNIEDTNDLIAANKAFRDQLRIIADDKSPSLDKLKYLTLFNNPLELIYERDLQGNFLAVNKRTLDVLGYRAEELKKLTIADILHPDDLKQAMWDIENLLPNQVDIETREYRLLTRDGKELWVELEETILYQNKEVRSLIGMARDISKRKSAEQKLISSEQRFRDLAEMLPQIVFETDRETNCTFINHQGSDITGYTQKYLLNNFKILDLIIPEERDRWAARIAKILNGATSSPKEFMAQRKDGSQFPIITNMVAIRRNSEIIGLRGVAFEISERKHLEKRLLDSQRIETIGTLASGIAHDINNVLATIGELGSLLYEELEESAPQRADVEAILTMTQRGGAFLRNLLGFAKPGSGIKRKFSLNQMVTQAAQLLSHSLSKKISIITNLSMDLQLVEGDQNQLFQVLMNLCINAGDALENGGAITITTRNKTSPGNGLDSSSVHCSPQVELIVRDNGMGMDAETQRKAFEPFFTTKDSNSGTGLGLFMVRSVVLNHGGQIYIESEKGMGTRVLMALPAVDNSMDQSEQKPTWQAQKSVDSCTVLLVEDEDLLLTTGTRLLKKLGHDVLIAQNGAIALEVFSEQCKNIDLVILDLEMPIMGGAECFEKLLEMDPSVRILVTTGFATAYPIEHSFESGKYGFLQKPFTVNELDSAISNVLERV